MGRPSDYNEETAAELCARMVDGPRSLRSVCRDDDMPALATVFRWLERHESFREQYARACEARADADAEEIRDIADDGTNDWMEKTGKEGEHLGWILNGEAVQRSRLRVDTRKWLMAKMKPKKYGERVALDHGGKIGLESLIASAGADDAPAE